MRPHCIEFLEKMKEIFTVVVFTASNQNYADAVLDELDPYNEIFSLRLYRQDCFNHEGNQLRLL